MPSWGFRDPLVRGSCPPNGLPTLPGWQWGLGLSSWKRGTRKEIGWPEPPYFPGHILLQYLFLVSYSKFKPLPVMPYHTRPAIHRRGASTRCRKDLFIPNFFKNILNKKSKKAGLIHFWIFEPGSYPTFLAVTINKNRTFSVRIIVFEWSFA